MYTYVYNVYVCIECCFYIFILFCIYTALKCSYKYYLQFIDTLDNKKSPQLRKNTNERINARNISYLWIHQFWNLAFIQVQKLSDKKIIY